MATVEKRGRSTWRVGVRVEVSGKWEWVRKNLKFPDAMSDDRQRAEAQLEAVKLEEDVAAGRLTPSASYTVASFAEKWMRDYIVPECAPTTAGNYRNFLDCRIIPQLGHIALEKLTPLQVSEWLAALRSERCRTTALPDEDLKNGKRSAAGQQRHEKIERQQKTLSDRTVRHYYDCLKSMYDKAEQWGVVTFNPVARVDRPKIKKKKKIRYLDDDEAVRLLRCLQSEKNMCYRAAVMLALLCSLRLGEVGALKLSHVDWENGTIDISAALKYTPQKGSYESAPKTEAGQRLIALPAGMMTLLEETRAYQNDCAKTFPGVWKGEGYIVHGWDGGRLHHDTPSKWFRKFADKNGFNGITFHQLRHSHATLLFANNIDAVAVASRLGHSDASVTLKFYARALRKRDTDAANVMQSLLDRAQHPTDD